MGNGDEKDQDIEESTSGPNNNEVSLTPLVEVVNSAPESGSGPDLETTDVKGLDNASGRASDSSDSSDDKDVHVTSQVHPQPLESNNIFQSNADTQSFGNDKADVKDDASDSSDSDSFSHDKDAQIPPQALTQPVESNNVYESNADTQPPGNNKADVLDNASDSSDSNSFTEEKDAHVPPQVLPPPVESNNVCQYNVDAQPFGSDKANTTDNVSDSSDDKDAHIPPQVLPQSEELNTQPFGNDRADVTDNASDSSHSNSSSDDEEAHVPRQVRSQSEEPNHVCQSVEESMSRHSNSTCESSPPNISPMASPPIQAMEKHQQDSGSTMSKPSTPSKQPNWSTTSNESLFSIQCSVFPRDPVSRTDADLAKPGDLHKSGELLSIAEELFPVGETGESPVSEEPSHSGELYKPVENFRQSDVTQGVLVIENRAPSVSKEEETRLEYVPLRNTSSKKSSDGSTPTLSSSKSGANAQTSTSPPEKKSRSWALCWPACCPAIPCSKKIAKCCTWPICLQNCFCKITRCCGKCSAPSCKWFTCSSCSGKWFTCSSCSGKCCCCCCCCCCCQGSSCWPFKCCSFSGKCCSCLSKCWCSKRC